MLLRARVAEVKELFSIDVFGFRGRILKKNRLQYEKTVLEIR